VQHTTGGEAKTAPLEGREAIPEFAAKRKIVSTWGRTKAPPPWPLLERDFAGGTRMGIVHAENLFIDN